tara:strand:+ start:6000 stop:6380 length:381 start_codon:yes stop_codon:yes gene_type:complete
MSDSVRISGQVKWFNNKAGYGFITVTCGEQTGKDVFVHHSAVETTSDMYKYLVQGEHVSFVMLEVEGDKHECQAGIVRGSNDGKLMCETRSESRSRTGVRRNNRSTEKRVLKDEDGVEWIVVKKKE